MRGLNAFVQLLAVDVLHPPPPRAGAGLPSSILPSHSIAGRISLQHLPKSDLSLPGWQAEDGRRSLPRGRGRLPALIPAAARGSARLPAEPSHPRDRLAAPHLPSLAFAKRSFRTQAFKQCFCPCVVRWSRSYSPTDRLPLSAASVLLNSCHG